MSDDPSIDEFGPVDYLVVEFPPGASSFTGEMAAELLKLADSGAIRLLDLIILAKDDDGAVEALELNDLEDMGELAVLETEIAELLAVEDVAHHGVSRRRDRRDDRRDDRGPRR